RLVFLPLSEQAHRPVERRCARDVGVVRAGLRRGEQGLVSGGIVTAAVFGHAEGQQVPLSKLPNLPELHRRATQGKRPFELDLVGVRQDTASLGGALGRHPLVGLPGEREYSLARGGEFLLLPEPCLQGGNFQGEQGVLRIGGGRFRQIRNCL